MNELLDSRQLPEHDPQLVRHADDCERCASTLKLQCELFQCMGHRPHVVHMRRRDLSLVRRSIGIAAASVAIVLLTISSDSPRTTQRTTSPAPAVEVADSSDTLATEPSAPNLLVGLMHGDFSKLLPEETSLTDNAWLDQVSGGVKPLANSMSSTLNVLRRTWPSTGSQDHGSDNAVIGAGTS